MKLVVQLQLTARNMLVMRTVVSGGGWIGGKISNALDFNGSST